MGKLEVTKFQLFKVSKMETWTILEFKTKIACYVFNQQLIM